MAIIISPVKGYNGITACVPFKDGVGETDSPYLIGWFKRKGYSVMDSTPAEAQAKAEAEAKAKAEAEAKAKAEAEAKAKAEAEAENEPTITPGAGGETGEISPAGGDGGSGSDPGGGADGSGDAEESVTRIPLLQKKVSRRPSILTRMPA
jgi:hypothetical protein